MIAVKCQVNKIADHVRLQGVSVLNSYNHDIKINCLNGISTATFLLPLLSTKLDSLVVRQKYYWTRKFHAKFFFSLILVAKGLLFQNLQGALGRVHSVHPWAFWEIQDGVQNGRRCKELPITHVVFDLGW